MKRIWFGLVGVILLSSTACHGGSGGTFASGKFRYKMTVTVATPEGDKVGYAVREVSATHGLQFLPESGASVHLKGEAVVIDLCKRGVVFALLTGPRLGADYAKDLPSYIFPHQHPSLSAKGIEEMNSIVQPPKELRPDWYPTFVYFKDINDPKTVEKLIEMETCKDNPKMGVFTALCVKEDRFAQVFGEGVALKSVMVETTQKPITVEIEQWLPWLSKQYGSQFDGQRFQSIKSEYPVANRLSVGAFSTEIYKNAR